MIAHAGRKLKFAGKPDKRPATLKKNVTGGAILR
jgi:hypothetical protein